MKTNSHTQSECPFCRTNGLLRGDVVAESGGAFLLEQGVLAGHYLIIPNDHVESVFDLPDTWWQDVKKLMASISGLPESYNIALNYGTPAGQSVEHLHFWVIPRKDGLPASGKGLARLIEEFDHPA